MMRRMRFTSWAAVAVGVLLSGCASEAQRQAADEKKTASVAATLIRAGDADSLAAAALLHRVLDGRRPERNDTSALMASATAAAPERADLAWLELSLCEAGGSCDPQAVEARLQVLDPANGAGWLDALARARRANDPAAAQAALAAIARSERVDFYWTTLVSHLASALTGAGRYDASTALLRTVGVLAAISWPLQPLSKACASDGVQVSDALATCRAVARSFQQGDTLLGESFGTRMAERLWPEDSTEHHEAVETRRVLQYRLIKTGELEGRLAWNSPGHLRALLQLYAADRREEDVFVAELTLAGVDPNPPPEWTEAKAIAASTAIR